MPATIRIRDVISLNVAKPEERSGGRWSTTITVTTEDGRRHDIVLYSGAVKEIIK